MTNVTLSIENETYGLMKKYSEIKWSEFIRKAIRQRVLELNQIEKDKNNEGIMTMFASEEVLKKDWDNEADERWNDV
jgi:metal-responsive CopG/Arc/MetJ family transcriptional regulator|tara:strand:+ start:490 stop:720 length:231 start_codon:yes stop_codon:yes gene_type:complete